MPYKLRFFADFCLALTASQTLIRGSLDIESEPTELKSRLYTLGVIPVSVLETLKFALLGKPDAGKMGSSLIYIRRTVIYQIGTFSNNPLFSVTWIVAMLPVRAIA